MNPSATRHLFTVDYLVMVTLVALGTVQLAAAAARLRGLWLVPGRTATRVAGVLLVVAGLAYFYLEPLWVAGPWRGASGIGTVTLGALPGARNVNDIDGGLAGGQQAELFLAATAVALLVSVIAGWIGFRMRPVTADPDASEGLEGLRTRSYPANVARTWRARRERRR